MRSSPESLAVLAVLLLAGCGAGDPPPVAGNDETDRVAQAVTDAIGSPPQASARDYARAAAQTTEGRDGTLSVVEATDDEADVARPWAQLIFLVTLEGSGSGTKETEETDPVTACYRVQFGPDGPVDAPSRVDCPNDATPVGLAPRS